MSDVTQSKGKSAQVRLRATEAEKERLEGQALEAGYKKKDGSANLSEYLRKVLLESHTVVVRPGEDLLLIPGAFTTAEGQADVEAVLGKVLAGLNSQTPVPGSKAPSSPAEGGGATAEPIAPPSAAPPAPEILPDPSSPAEGVVVGTGASHTPPGEIPPPPPPAQEFCSNCGAYYLTGQHAAGSAACVAARNQRLAGETEPGTTLPTDAAPLQADELEPEPNPPLGPPQPGESEIEFMGRRVSELKADGRPSAIARAEAGGEWRAATGGTPHPLEPASPAPTAVPPPNPPPAPTHRICGGCGATVALTGLCPECGATH